MPSHVRQITRFALCLAVTALVACAVELAYTWPSEGGGLGFVLLLAVQIFTLTSLWTIPLSLFALLVVIAVQKVREPPPPDERAAADLLPLALLPPFVFLCATIGQGLHVWSSRAFVRQDLAAAVVPAAQLALYALVGGFFWIAYRLGRSRLPELPRWVGPAACAMGTICFGAIHLARFPEILQDALWPMALQVLVTAAAATAAMALPGRHVRVRPGRVTIAILLTLPAAFALLMLYGGRVAPLSYPVASAALQTRGLAAARAARVANNLGDRDGDGFSHYFGGLDCDDNNPGIHPLAKDLPDNGVDEDCFEGDQTSAQVAAVQEQRASQRREPRQRVRNVILITIDALRADAVGWSGAPHPTTPSIDRRAAQSVVFERAYTPAPMTRRAFPSLLSGLYPSNVHWLDLQTSYIYTVAHADNRFLAEVLRDAGIATGSVVAFSYARLSRFDQGFSQHKVHPASRFKKEINANVIVDDAIAMVRRWADRATTGAEPRRFFLWLHFYEPHYPYVTHKGIRFGTGKEPWERYLGEVRWVDNQLARFLTELDSLGINDETALIVAGDHGEEFGEHGGEHHGDLYPEDLHVPLLIQVPGLAPRRIDAPVSLIDVAPTVTELLGVPIPDEVDGVSLVPYLEGETPPQDGIVFAELIPDRKVPRRVLTIVDARWQLIVDFALGARELYDLSRDPTAQRNRLVEAPDQARRLEARLRRHLALRIGPMRVSKAPRAPKAKAKPPR